MSDAISYPLNSAKQPVILVGKSKYRRLERVAELCSCSFLPLIIAKRDVATEGVDQVMNQLKARVDGH